MRSLSKIGKRFDLQSELEKSSYCIRPVPPWKKSNCLLMYRCCAMYESRSECNGGLIVPILFTLYILIARGNNFSTVDCIQDSLVSLDCLKKDL